MQLHAQKGAKTSLLQEKEIKTKLAIQKGTRKIIQYRKILPVKKPMPKSAGADEKAGQSLKMSLIKRAIAKNSDGKIDSQSIKMHRHLLLEKVAAKMNRV